MNKVCACCKIEKDEKEFPIKQGRLYSYCLKCSTEKVKEWREKHPNRNKEICDKWKAKQEKEVLYKKYKNKDLKRAYGITYEDYKRMLNDQNNKCAICKNDLETPQVDHCHETHTIREILCNHCNRGLGGFKDNINYLESAIEYLRKHAKS